MLGVDSDLFGSGYSQRALLAGDSIYHPGRWASDGLAAVFGPLITLPEMGTKLVSQYIAGPGPYVGVFVCIIINDLLHHASYQELKMHVCQIIQIKQLQYIFFRLQDNRFPH